jgi:hypothetical protein
MQSEVTKEQIAAFLAGSNPMERIIKIETDYNSDKVYVIYRDENGNLKCQVDKLYPFLWAKTSVAQSFFKGDRKKIKAMMQFYHIVFK